MEKSIYLATMIEHVKHQTRNANYPMGPTKTNRMVLRSIERAAKLSIFYFIECISKHRVEGRKNKARESN